MFNALRSLTKAWTGRGGALTLPHIQLGHARQARYNEEGDGDKLSRLPTFAAAGPNSGGPLAVPRPRPRKHRLHPLVFC